MEKNWLAGGPGERETNCLWYLLYNKPFEFCTIYK